ncbi:FAD-dependent oxidoreductase [Defluviimonas sp. D31]|uniref:FAD-dependent oxidoreductase n=1 Tax=Defluviimonas sp. D31 TaxID=3083253 RepID=UPI00296EC46E|nr:FAD-dependent oxidoreductase [Defluviimonas sp. D31]MDW4551237.1 FAD-dependent oxidoreductase [Defluviimonas sp. D31]
MKTSARVVVIGGGVVGCSVLYHLARNGWTDVVLLERQELTSGSSWHAAGGLFTVVRPNSAAEMHRYTFRIYRELEKESGQSCGFHFTGGINICRTQDEIDSNARMQSACRRLGIEGHFISLEEAKAKAPVLDTRHMVGAFWEEEGGHVDPASATNAFAAAARKLGAAIHRFTPVTATSQRADGTWDVVTDKGAIHAEYVVNAAGLWGREVARLAGIELPLMPVEHHYLVTEPIPMIEDLGFELPQINDNETGCYARQEGVGLLLGAYEHKMRHWAKDGTPPDFGHELLPDDLSCMEWNFEKSVEIMPCLAEAGVKRVINGPMIFSPDLGPLIGPHPALRNYFCANGVMAGFNQGGGIGRVLAEWIIGGEPSLDIFNWDVARFGAWATRKYTEEMTRYFYENRSEKVFPYQSFPAARPLAMSPVHDRLAAEGAVFGTGFGREHVTWYAPKGMEAKDSLTYRQPNWWGQVAEEGRRVREAVGLYEFSDMAKFEVSGANAGAWLDRIMANRLPKPGRLCLSPMLSESGRVIGDFTISNLGDRYLVVGTYAMQLAYLRHFRKYLPAEGVTLKNLSDDLAGLSIAGPKAQALISALAERDMDTTHFRFMDAGTMTLAGVHDVTTLRVSYTGETGYETYLAKADQPRLFDAIRQEGARHGLSLVGLRSLMMLRLEKGYPAWGTELAPDYYAHECGMMPHVKLDKGDFVGRDAAASYGLARERPLVLTVDAGEFAIWGDEAIFLDGEPVGYVSSGGFGPVVGKHIALGYVRPDAFREGGSYAVEVFGELRAAELQARPLYDPDGVVMRS